MRADEEAGGMMVFERPVTHGHEGYAVFQVVRGSDLHHNAEAIGLVVQRGWKDYPDEPVIAVLVDGEVMLEVEK
jgi:hypothetical protein